MSENNPVLDTLRQFIDKEFEGSPCPFTHWLKPVVRSVSHGALIFEYTVREDMTNPYGILHGGVTASIIDDLIGTTVYSLNLSNPFTTINNNIDYFAPAAVGDVVEARSKVIKKGVQIINLQCEIWLPKKNRLLANGYSNMIRLENRGLK